MTRLASFLACVVMVCGTGLFVYGILGFTPVQQGPAMLSITDTRAPGSGYIYETEPRVESAVAAVLIIGGWLWLRLGKCKD